eukprot:2326941-Prymnesium_polylepis.1
MPFAFRSRGRREPRRSQSVTQPKTGQREGGWNLRSEGEIARQGAVTRALVLTGAVTSSDGAREWQRRWTTRAQPAARDPW